MELGDLPINALRAIAVPFGLLWGSFLNVVIYRTPREESVVRPGSHCPACGKPVAPYDNIPVLSFLILRGRARCCGAKLSWRYPLVELLGGAASLAVLELCVAPLGPHASAVRALVVYLADFATILGLIAAAFIDFEFMYIPDGVTLGGTVLGILTASLRGGTILGAVVSAVLGFLVTYIPFIFLYRIVRGRAGMGMGDAKLLMMAGAFFGPYGIFWTLLAGAVQGALAAFVVWLVRGKIALPQGVQEELEELRKAAAAGDEEAKEALEEDPLAQEQDPEEVGLAHFAFGPFLALAFIEFLLLGGAISDLAHQLFFL
ncbi:MAG TPA: prepilin peptidase [Polyangiaceae bacterium]|nr:prepilin peptidase [Polyangiaceae bacterium]